MQARALTTLLALALGATLATASPAAADNTAPPIVEPDTVSIYPGGSVLVDVLENDLSGSGQDLALCRFPEDDVFSLGMASVSAMTGSLFGLPDPGSVMVSAGPRAHGTHTIDYFVCDRTHLAPATLTVEIRDVEPVDVTKVRGEKGRLSVTNHNDKPVRLRYGHPRSYRPDGRVRVAPGETVTVRVQRHAIAWVALIGGGSSKGSLFSSAGIADYGTVRDIELDGPALPLPGHGGWHGGPHGQIDVISIAGRWR